MKSVPTPQLFVVLIIVSLIVFSKSSAQESNPQNSIVTVIQDAKGVSMVYLPEGTFNMGIDLNDALVMCPLLVPEKYILQVCQEKVLEDFSSLSEPQIITVSHFYIDQFEVSLGQYLECVNADVCTTDFLLQEMEAIQSGDNVPMDFPVLGASYYYAAIYCAWRGGRLPTEAEWEYAARSSNSNNFPWGNNFDGSYVNFCDESCQTASEYRWNDGYSQESPINAFEPGQSWAGIYNLSGNVAEWTSTRQTTESGLFSDSRVVKGGSFLSFALETAAWSRFLTLSDNSSETIGFRCVRKVPL